MFRRKARARTSCADIRDWRVAILWTQLTVGELSLNSATCRSDNWPQTPSTQSHKSSSPAISKSELVSRPLGFVNDTTSAVISAGHWKRKTVGGHSPRSPIMMPPTPKLDASTTPTKSGQAVTRFRQCVGWVVDVRRIKRMSVIASRRALLRWRYTNAGRPRNTQLHGLSKPRPSGRAVKAWRSLAVTLSNSCRGIPVCERVAPRNHLCNVPRSRDRLLSSSQIVLSSPSKSKPRIHFFVVNSPSRLISFFSEIGSLPGVSSAGNTSCIPSITPLATCRICCQLVGMTRAMKSST